MFIRRKGKRSPGRPPERARVALAKATLAMVDARIEAGWPVAPSLRKRALWRLIKAHGIGPDAFACIVRALDKAIGRS